MLITIINKDNLKQCSQEVNVFKINVRYDIHRSISYATLENMLSNTVGLQQSTVPVYQITFCIINGLT